MKNTPLTFRPLKGSLHKQVIFFKQENLNGLIVDFGYVFV